MLYRVVKKLHINMASIDIAITTREILMNVFCIRICF